MFCIMGFKLLPVSSFRGQKVLQEKKMGDNRHRLTAERPLCRHGFKIESGYVRTGLASVQINFSNNVIQKSLEWTTL